MNRDREKPLAGKVHIPVVWEKVGENLWKGKITDDLLFTYDTTRTQGRLAVPENVIRPMRCDDKETAVDAANNITIEYWHTIITAHLRNRATALIETEYALTVADYEQLLQITREQLIQRYLQAGRRPTQK